MASTLAQMRARLAAQENRTTQPVGGDQTVYPHWNIPEGTSARLRFLPDGDPKNEFFWIERLMINLEFAGIAGQLDSKPVLVSVPCMEMYGRDTPCPVLAEVRNWFKDPSMEEIGRKYWKKKSYLFQGFVRDNPLSDDKTPENPIRRFLINPQIFTLVKGVIMDPEVESLPTDYENGFDFTITKTTKGKYADYTSSKWARKESALSSAELDAIQEHGLFNLVEFLPKKPGAEELRVIKEMFEASVNGEAYDPARWANFYKPRGLRVGTGSDGEEVATPIRPNAPVRQTAPVVQPAAVAKPEKDRDEWDDDDDGDSVAETTPVITPQPAAASSKRAEDILALIRSRQVK